MAVLKHMHNKDHSKPGRDLCQRCYQYYLDKTGTVRRSSAAPTQAWSLPGHRKDVQKRIAQAQRGHVNNDVQAVGANSSRGVQDQAAGYVTGTTSGPLQTPGPTIHLPGNIHRNNIPPVHVQGRGPQPVGYTAAHASYPAVRHERIQQAYSTHNAEVGVVEVRMVLKLPGRVQEQLIHDLVEAVDHIPVHIGAVDLKRTLYDAVIPKWNAWTRNFPLPIEKIAMRDRLWVELKPRNPDCDVIARYFFKSGKNGALTFKPGTKTIIQFHVPNELYNAMLDKREADETADVAVARRVTGREGVVVELDDDVELSMAADFTVGISKGKKRARSLSPASQQEDFESSDIEEIKSPVKSAKSKVTKPPAKRSKAGSSLRTPRTQTHTGSKVHLRVEATLSEC
ncbi:hypothetical protein LshimejAT787_0705740 [Lyophyllum shimeji]|uniref:Uncharacterized protein n=1 Tax=Lyophyllum shimeji TaxID=47721 RepID=A0A9P3PR69_LYOSH|nr:hypothetical protein LshimejAT787_0705740 [Lyophyllum shimeji]